MPEALPLVKEVTPVPDVESALRAMADLPHCLLLDSAMAHPSLGRYSFLTADPFAWLQAPADGHDALAALEARVSSFSTRRLDGLPPFQGGAAGLFAYDLNRCFERVPAARFDEFQVPGLAVGLYDVVLAIDHAQQRAWIVSQGFPASEPADRRQRAHHRMQAMLRRLEHLPGARPVRQVASLSTAIPADRLSPQYACDGPRGLTSNFTADGYRAAVQRVVDYIHAGDAFQVNLAQRLLFPVRDKSLDLYLRLRRCNPAPFAAYFDLGTFQVVSASPERFLRVSDGWVETRPIKGTRQRSRFPEADLYAGDDLLGSEKDRAENVMIVDLLRNDLSRVCRPDSVRVTQLCQLETYQYVQHLVSAVVGQLETGRTPLELLRAAFPGGSITGAPKVRAMQIIAELEPNARGPYCGSLGYVGFDGSMDSSILIRTITAGRGWWQLPVGGGIVAQSVPNAEYEETWHKATGLLRAL